MLLSFNCFAQNKKPYLLDKFVDTLKHSLNGKNLGQIIKEWKYPQLPYPLREYSKIVLLDLAQNYREVYFYLENNRFSISSIAMPHTT